MRYSILILLCWLCAGCATPAGRYGTEARYAPAFRGYVLAEDDGSDDPDADATTMVLTDPVTGDKLQCREEVVRWIAPHQDHAEDMIHDENLEVASAIALAPLGSFGMYLAAPGMLMLATAMAPADIGRSKDGQEMFVEGEELFRRERWDEARILLERALVRAPLLARHSKVLLYLGVVYAKLERDDEAQRALHSFVRRSAVRDVKAYRTAERWLDALGAPSPGQCGSREPLPVKWSQI